MLCALPRGTPSCTIVVGARDCGAPQFDCVLPFREADPASVGLVAGGCRAAGAFSVVVFFPGHRSRVSWEHGEAFPVVFCPASTSSSEDEGVGVRARASLCGFGVRVRRCELFMPSMRLDCEPWSSPDDVSDASLPLLLSAGVSALGGEASPALM